MSPQDLIDFETKIGDMFNNKEIKAPVHLYHGNEEKMIRVFEAINKDKAHRMQRLAMAWLATHGCFGCDYAIDAAAVLINSDGSHSLEYRGGLL